MSRAERLNERTVRGLFNKVINDQAYEMISRYCTPDVVMHRPGNTSIKGQEAYENHYRALHDALPNLEATLTDVLVDEDRVATRFVVVGTHDGELLGVESTGTRVRFSAQVLFHLSDGTITQEFHQSDRASLRAQIGQKTTSS